MYAGIWARGMPISSPSSASFTSSNTRSPHYEGKSRSNLTDSIGQVPRLTRNATKLPDSSSSAEIKHGPNATPALGVPSAAARPHRSSVGFGSPRHIFTFGQVDSRGPTIAQATTNPAIVNSPTLLRLQMQEQKLEDEIRKINKALQ